ncbi:MAG: hypothetical protein ABIR16_08755 [Dokdonella sp.]
MTDATEEVDGDAIAAETMLGDLVSLVLDEIRAAPDVWPRLGQQEQDDVIDRVKRRCGEAVEDCVRIIATQGFSRIRATVESVAIKDGIKAVVTLSKHDPNRHELADAQGSSVYLVLADPEQFSGGTAGIKGDPDQGALLLGQLDRIAKESRDGETEGAE